MPVKRPRAPASGGIPAGTHTIDVAGECFLRANFTGGFVYTLVSVASVVVLPYEVGYSSRSACMTSMREARAAGTSEAMIAAPTRTPAASVSGTASGSVTEVK
jgi:hypothetical protein